MNTATYLALERRVGVYWTSGTATFRSRRLKLEKLKVSGAGKITQQKRHPVRSALKNGGPGQSRAETRSRTHFLTPATAGIVEVFSPCRVADTFIIAHTRDSVRSL